MFTEDWKSRYNYNDGQLNDGQNRERRPYQSYNNRSGYGNNQSGNYGRQDNRGSYNRPSGNNYDRQSGNRYDRQGGNGYDRQGGNGYDRQGGNGYERQGNGNYNRPRPNYEQRQSSGYNSRPQRNYDNSTSENSHDGVVKKRRLRVGEMAEQRQNNAYNRNQAYQKPQPRPKQKQGGFKKPQDNPKFNANKLLKYREEHFDPEELIRLNKYLANAGVCSRREADEFIQAGLIKVNGTTVTELGTKVKRADEVTFHDDPVKLEHKIYVVLNKPRNCVTTADDPQERLTVMDLVKSACQERIFPVGRLDRNTTGVLLLTNDGDLASKLTHPKFEKKKIYHVWLDKNVSVDDMQKLAEGIELEDGEIHADAISYVDENLDQVGIEIHSGRNRVVRRMFESLGYHVTKLDRVYFAGLTKKNLKKGHWRYLNEYEVAKLRDGSFE